MENQEVLEQLVLHLRERVLGKFRGRVTDNADPDKRGRVRVVVPAVLGKAEVWAMPCVPFAGKDVGLFAMPPVGAGVWVEFEAGDIDYPIWTGCFWADKEIPGVDAKPSIKFLRTSRVQVRIDDEQGSIEISIKDGATLTLNVTDFAAKASSITHEAGVKRTELNTTQFDVHDGAFTVV